MLDYEEIHRAVYIASVKAAQKTGDEYKNVLWFPRNRKELERLD